MQIVIDWPETAPYPTAVRVQYPTPRNTSAEQRKTVVRMYRDGASMDAICTTVGRSLTCVKDIVRCEIPIEQRRAQGWHRKKVKLEPRG